MACITSALDKTLSCNSLTGSRTRRFCHFPQHCCETFIVTHITLKLTHSTLKLSRQQLTEWNSAPVQLKRSKYHSTQKQELVCPTRFRYDHQQIKTTLADSFTHFTLNKYLSPWMCSDSRMSHTEGKWPVAVGTCCHGNHIYTRHFHNPFPGSRFKIQGFL